MRKSLLDKNKVDLDLTSLLDVIFIILMIVMCYQYMKPSEPTTVNPVPEDIKDRVYFATLVIEPESELNLENRNIKMYIDDTEKMDINVSSLDEVTEKEAYENMKTELTNLLEANPGIPVLVTLNDEKVLYRDVKMVSKVIEEIGNTNLYWNSGEMSDNVKEFSDN